MWIGANLRNDRYGAHRQLRWLEFPSQRVRWAQRSKLRAGSPARQEKQPQLVRYRISAKSFLAKQEQQSGPRGQRNVGLRNNRYDNRQPELDTTLSCATS